MHRSVLEIRSSEIGEPQVGARKISESELCSPDVRPVKDCQPELCPIEIRSPKISVGQIGRLQIRPLEVGVFQVDHAKLGFPKVRATHIWMDIRTSDPQLVPYLSGLQQQSDLLLVCHSIP